MPSVKGVMDEKVKDKADGGRVCGYEGVGLEGHLHPSAVTKC